MPPEDFNALPYGDTLRSRLAAVRILSGEALISLDAGDLHHAFICYDRLRTLLCERPA